MAKALDDAAQALVTEARGNGKLAALAPCSSATTMGATCATTFITSFGAKAYRRALTSAEASALMTLYQAGATGGTYNDGIDLVTRGILQSAGFLYVTQLGSGAAGSPALTQNELASTLSYLLTGTPPDQTLLDLAAAGGLATRRRPRDAGPAAARARRRGKNRMVRLVREWLGIDRIAGTAKDATVYSDFTAACARRWTPRAPTFIDEVVQQLHRHASASC